MTARSSVQRTRLAIELLEDRSVPATVSLSSNGVLTILGNSSNETLHVAEVGGVISVSGESQTFNAASINTIVIDGGEGTDNISIAANSTKTAWIYGGGGNDTIRGGSGKNYIFGGNGNDVITGGSSQDQIYGGGGTNSITAPAGATVVAGNNYQAATLTSMAQEILTLVNQYRAQNGVAPLTANVQLTAAAKVHTDQMVGMVPYVGFSSAMSHTLIGSVAPTMVTRSQLVGYDYLALGENIAYGFTSAQSVMNAWINSAGHRANLLNASFTQIGVAISQTAGGTMYFAQEFGTPSGNTVAPPPTSTTPPAATSPAPTTTTSPSTGFGAGSTAAGKAYAVGSDQGSAPMVTLYDAASGAVKQYFAPYDSSFRGGVRVATGDVNGDGQHDLVVAPGAGMAGLIKVYNGTNGQLIRSFNAYMTAFTGGVQLAMGDVNGDGRADIITGADTGGGPHVKVFDGATGAEIRSFFAYSPYFAGGVRVAAGDVNGDGRTDIITGAGPGGGPHVRVFSGTNGAELRSFFAYAMNFTGGVNVTAADLNGDGKADIVTGASAGGGPHVQAFSGNDLSVLSSFFAGTPTFTGGVKVRAMDANGDGRTDIVANLGGSKDLKCFSTNGTLLGAFVAGDPTNLGGVFVG